MDPSAILSEIVSQSPPSRRHFRLFLGYGSRSVSVDLGRYSAALRHPGFRLLFFSLLPGTLGMMMALVAFGYVAYQLSQSATTLALVNLGWGIPMFLLSAFAGEVADRYPRRNVVLATQGIVGLSAVIAAVLIGAGVIQV